MTFVNQHSVYAVGIVFPILGFIFVGLRFYVRLVKDVRLGLDDYASFLGLVFVTGCGICNIVGAATHTVGYHTPDSSTKAALENHSPKFVVERKLEYAYILLLFPALGFIKLSILLFYRRIFRGRRFDITNWTAIFLLVAWLIAFEIADIFACGIYPDAEWTSLQATEEKCFNVQVISVVGAVTEVAMDFFIIIIPLPFIWKLKLPLKKKISVSIIFIIGGLSIAAGTIRMVVFAEAFKTAVVNTTILGIPGTDVVGIRSLGFFWLMVEVGIAQVVSCLLPLWPLLQGPRDFFRSIKLSTFTSFHSSSSGRGTTSNATRRSDGNFKRLYDPTETGGQLPTAGPSIFSHEARMDRDVETQEGPTHTSSIGVRKDVFTMTELVKDPKHLNLGESMPGTD